MAVFKRVLMMWLAIVALSSYSQAQTKRVICVSATQDAAITSAEGFERVGLRADRDVVQNGGNIADCLANLANGDELILIAHGTPGTFNWGGTAFTGFGQGQGRNPAPIPAGFANLRNITARLDVCFSATADREGRNPSIIDRLRTALGGAGRGHRFIGYAGAAEAVPVATVRGAIERDVDRATDALENDPRWMANPPVNRPGTGGEGQPANHRTAAQALVDTAVGRGAVRVELPAARGRRQRPSAPGYTLSAADFGPAAGAAGSESCGAGNPIFIKVVSPIEESSTLLAADLTGDQEVPPVDTDARELASFSITPDGDLYYLFSFCRLEAVTAAHVHAGAPGESGPIILPLSLAHRAEGIIHGVAIGVDQETVDAMLNGAAYINIHTASYPDGEVRGQIYPDAFSTGAGDAQAAAMDEAPVDPCQARAYGARTAMRLDVMGVRDYDQFKEAVSDSCAGLCADFSQPTECLSLCRRGAVIYACQIHNMLPVGWCMMLQKMW